MHRKSDGSLRQNPPKRYGFIDQESWNQFIAYRLTGDFKEKSAKNKEIAKQNKYRHNMARKGYAGLEEELDKLQASDGEEGVDQYNIVSQAIGIVEHPGRHRGLGLGVTKTSVRGRSRGSRNTDEQVAILTQKLNVAFERMATMEQELSFIKSQGYKPSDLVDHDQLYRPNVNSVRDSCEADTRLSSLFEGLHKCDLLANDLSTLLAKGRVRISHSTQTQTVHGYNLALLTRSVSIDTPIIGSASLPCYKEGDEAATMLEAHGSFVPWPVDQIRLTTKEESKKKTAPASKTKRGTSRTINTKEGAAKKKRAKSEKSVAPQKIRSSEIRQPPPALALLYFYAQNYLRNNYISIDCRPEYIGRDDATYMVSTVDISDIYNQKWMSTTSVVVYVTLVASRAALEGMLSSIVFVCPYYIADSSTITEGRHINYLADRILIEGHNKLYLIPHLATEHWVLYAVRPDLNKVYVFDSLRTYDVPFEVACHGGKEFIDMAIRMAYQRRGENGVPDPKNLQYEPIMCPQQQNGDDCGYYVCKAMDLIVQNRSVNIDPSHFFTDDYARG